MRKLRLFPQLRSKAGVPKSGSDTKSSPKLYQPFRAPKPPSDMLLVQRWKGHNRKTLLTILRHWSLHTDYLTPRQRPLLSPLFWGSFRILRGFLHSRYPEKVEKGAYTTPSLFLSPGKLPLLDMVWEEQPRGGAFYPELTSSVPLEEGQGPLAEGKFPPTPTVQRERKIPQGQKGPSPPVSAPEQRVRKLHLLKGILPFLHRLAKDRGSHKPGRTQSVTKAREIIAEKKVIPSLMEKGTGKILPRLEEKIWIRGKDGLSGVLRGPRKPSEPVVEQGFPQMPERSKSIPPANRQEKEAMGRHQTSRQLRPVSTRGEVAEILFAKPQLPPEAPMAEDEPQGIEPEETQLQRESTKPSPRGSPRAFTFLGFRTSLWTKKVLARIYPKSHLAKREKLAPKLRKGKIKGTTNHKETKKTLATGEGVVSPSPSPQRKELSKAESEIAEVLIPLTEKEEGSSGFGGEKMRPATDQVRVSLPISALKLPLASRVLARLYPKYRIVDRGSPQRGEEELTQEYEDGKASELRGRISQVSPYLPGGTVRPERASSPLDGKTKVSLQKREEEQSLRKKAELDQMSATEESTLKGEPTPSKSQPKAASLPQPIITPVFQATQAALRALGEGPGVPLDMGIRQKFESFFGMGLEEVRIHTGAGAAEVNKRLGAEAATMGSHIFLSPEVSTEDTGENIGLLAHELTHIAQNKTLKSPKRLVSLGLLGGGQPTEPPLQAGDEFPSMASKVKSQKVKAPTLMAARLQREAVAPSSPTVRAQITGVSAFPPEEERPKENLDEMAYLVYERIKRKLRNEEERLPD